MHMGEFTAIKLIEWSGEKLPIAVYAIFIITRRRTIFLNTDWKSHVQNVTRINNGNTSDHPIILLGKEGTKKLRGA